VQQDEAHITLITPTAPVQTRTHGGRAKCLQRLVRLDLPVPRTLALSFTAVRRIAAGELPDMARMLAHFGENALLCVRPSSEDPDWGGPGAVLNIGVNDARFVELSEQIGKRAASEIYLRFVQGYAIHVARLDPDMFDDVDADPVVGLSQALRAYEDETDDEFPQDPAAQLSEVLRSMARAWEGTTARLLRQAKGAPAEAGLGLVVQQLALGLGPVARIFHAIDRVEHAGEAARRHHPACIVARAVGMDDPPPRQPLDGRTQIGIGREMIERNIVHRLQIGAGVEIVAPHQPGKRRAMRAPVVVTDAVGLGGADLEEIAHEYRHPRLDLIEKARLGRVERIVEIEYPCRHMGKILFRHGRTIGQRHISCNRVGVDRRVKARKVAP